MTAADRDVFLTQHKSKRKALRRGKQ
jgi:hypothetical protein